MKANTYKILAIVLLCVTWVTQHMAQVDSTDTKVVAQVDSTDKDGVTYYPEYSIKIEQAVDDAPLRWEHDAISFFDEKENGERVLEGRAAFMGTGKKFGMRMAIGIKGNAYDHYGELGPYTPIMFKLENKRTIIFRVYYYESIYDPKTKKTFYKVAFNIDNEYRRMLQKQKIKSVAIGWIIGKEVYQTFDSDALMQQLENIKRARTDGIITRR